MERQDKDPLTRHDVESSVPPVSSIVLRMLPLALAIFVFGVIYGVLARPLGGTWLTMLSSALIFSGATQFAIAGLGVAAPALSVLALALTLNVRHILLGAVLRPRIAGSPVRRAVLSWFLLDESFGIATSSPGDAGRPLLISGLMGYGAWLAGTAIGIAGGSLASFEDIAAAAFPVLFLGLAATLAGSKDRWIRIGVAGVAVAILAAVAPGLRSIAPVLIAIVVAIPGGDE